METADLFREHAAHIYSYALKLTRNPKEAEDLAQDTFLKAFEKKDQLKEPAAAKYWLRKICLNVYLTARRRRFCPGGARETVQDPDVFNRMMLKQSLVPGPGDELVMDESIRRIQSACFLSMVHRMGETQRIAFSLVDMFGLSAEETAELLGLSQTAVKSHLHRARKKLDAFFLETCGLIRESNPCRCEAWEKFVLDREATKKRVRQAARISGSSRTDFKGKKEAAVQIRRLYRRMPDYRPSPEWYERMIIELGKFLG